MLNSSSKITHNAIVKDNKLSNLIPFNHDLKLTSTMPFSEASTLSDSLKIPEVKATAIGNS